MARFRCLTALETSFVLLLVCGPIEAQQWTNFGPAGGPLNGIYPAPSDPSTMYATGGRPGGYDGGIPAGVTNGGLFKTTDGGDSWRSISSGVCDVHVNVVAVHPTDPNTVYAGGLHGGICRSTDGGTTWTALNHGLAADADGYAKSVVAIVINQATPTVLNAAQSGGALLHSTDGGASWTVSSIHVTSGVDIAAAPKAPSTLYASAQDDHGAWAIFRSSDGGATWTETNNTLNRSGLISVNPSGAQVAYLSADTIYRTGDGGTTWNAFNTNLGAYTGLTRVVFDPGDPKIVFTVANGGCGLCTSTGTSWSAVVSSGLPVSFRWGQQSGVSSYVTSLALTTSVTMYATAGDGFYRSTDAGATWHSGGSPAAISWTIPNVALSSDAPASALFSTFDSHYGSVLNNVWILPGGAPGVTPLGSAPLATGPSSVAVDPRATSTVYVLDGCGYFFKTTDGGATWSSKNVHSQFCDWLWTVSADPAISGTLYVAATAGLYKTTSGGSTWTPITTLPAGPVKTVAISRLDSNVLYAAGVPETGINRIFRSVDAGTTWTALVNSPNLQTWRIAIDQTNDSIAYIATAGGIFQTTNGGSTWTTRTSGGWPITSGRPAPAYGIAVDPMVPATIYASPGSPWTVGMPPVSGVYRSNDSGATWALMPGTTGYSVSDIQIDAHRAAFAATNNGLLRLDLTTSIAIDKTALVFGVTLGAGTFSAATPSQTVRLTEAGFGGVPWTAKSDQPWLTVSPASGVGPGVLSVGVQFVPGLIGSQSGTITVSALGASNVLAPITTVLKAFAAGGSAPPFGSFDTPIDGTTGVAGSIAVTGWALDDVAVTSVRVVREPVPGEGAGLIFIGNAVRIDGARPDVAAAFPSAPRNTSAGWGYLLLTNFLPNQGNGTFRLHALADDADGHTTDLGVKTITCANSTSVRPFGALDTPGQGDVVSGVVPNFGWTLIRSGAGTNPRADIPGGGSVSIFVDGVAVGSPIGWTNRADLTALFPTGYSNLSSTLAVYNLDTTTLTNGVHTIFWSVGATNGQSDGIGSRFFTVSNGASEVSVAASPHVDPALMRAVTEPISGRRGFDLSTPYHLYYPDADGSIVVQAEELDRIELVTNATAGNLRTPQGLGPLPIGAHLDPATGTFTWAPGVGFVGAYDFVFVKDAERTNVRIVLNPKGSARVGPQVIVDAPVAGATVSGPFLLGGWAADLDAASGTGISTVHVWAYPVAGGDPSFLGVADSGVRPDVAAIYGDQFRESGYGLIVNDLPPGTYDLAVFGWSNAKRGFLPAQVARITVK